MGSLHADNVGFLAKPDETVELCLVARCWRPTIGSALWGVWEDRASGGGKAGSPIEPELFWVLCVEWHEGIARRKGVGQVLESALEDSGAVEVKNVLLG